MKKKFCDIFTFCLLKYWLLNIRYLILEIDLTLGGASYSAVVELN